jgi:opacity protein-like surface antigen
MAQAIPRMQSGPMPASAAPQAIFTQQQNQVEVGGNFYARLDGGVLAINDLEASASASASGITATSNFKLSFDPGYSFNGALGYRLNDYLAMEGEIGYASASYSTLEGTLTVSSGGSSIAVTDSTDVDGSVSLLTGMTNLVLTPFGRGDFMPYLGGGVGVASVTDEVNSIGGLQVDYSDDWTSLTTSAIAGFDYRIGRYSHVGMRYRYLWIDMDGTDSDAATAHVFSLAYRANF